MTVEQRFFLKTENALQKYKINCIKSTLNSSNELIKVDNISNYHFIFQDFTWVDTKEGLDFWQRLRLKWLRRSFTYISS